MILPFTGEQRGFRKELCRDQDGHEGLFREHVCSHEGESDSQLKSGMFQTPYESKQDLLIRRLK